jgi:hypothetical protein
MEEEDAVALLLKSATKEAIIHTEQIATEIVKVRELSLGTPPTLMVILTSLGIALSASCNYSGWCIHIKISGS